MTVHLRPPTLEQLLVVTRDLAADEIELWKRMTGVSYDAEQLAMHGYSYRDTSHIIHNGDEPIAAAGFVQIRTGVWRTWMLAREKAWAFYGREVTDTVRRVIETVIREKVAHRVETITLVDRKRAIAWYSKIGLTYEATQRKYGINGEDAVTYVALGGTENS